MRAMTVCEVFNRDASSSWDIRAAFRADFNAAHKAR
jgi:hypothetical protein